MVVRWLCKSAEQRLVYVSYCKRSNPLNSVGLVKAANIIFRVGNQNGVISSPRVNLSWHDYLKQERNDFFVEFLCYNVIVSSLL